MPNDLITLKSLTDELDELLSGGRIEKIYQPEKDELLLAVHNGGKYRLAISCSAENSRINITDAKKENPTVAPSFCMHLRKYISNAVIRKIKLYNNDRIVDIEFTAKNEMKDEVSYHLICEMMGRYSNVIFVDSRQKISDAMKTVSYDTATKRCILPSLPYEAPPQNKISVFDREAISIAMLEFAGGDVAKYLTSKVSGFAYSTTREIVERAGIDNETNAPDGEKCERLAKTIEKFLEPKAYGIYAPCCALNGEGIPSDYFITPYSTTTDKYMSCATLNEAVDKCLKIKDTRQRQHEKTKAIAVSIKRYKQKNYRTLQKAEEKIAECSKTETYRKYGELLTANLYALKKGDKTARVTDYYDENSPTIEVPLDPLLTPQANAREYFKKYAKLKRTKGIVEKQVEEIRALLEYVETIEESVAKCYTAQDVYELELELSDIGVNRKFKRDKFKDKKESTPLEYEIDGFRIFVGKNNIQNDKLTFKTARGSDMWLHTKGVHGSHTVVLCDGAELPDNVLLAAAELAAYYSSARNSVGVEVDYTLRRNVKRKSGAGPGMVNYTDYKSIKVDPTPHIDCLIN